MRETIVRASPRWIRAGRALLATLFAASAIGYYAAEAISFTNNKLPKVELGFDNPYLPDEQAYLVTAVKPDSPAWDSGMRPGDHIVAIDGIRITGSNDITNEWMRHEPGDTVRLTVLREGEPAPLILTGVFRLRSAQPVSEFFAQKVRNFFPLPFILVGLSVLFLRLKDRKAWLLALLFESFAATPGFPDDSGYFLPVVWKFLMAYEALLVGMLGALFYWFFAVFPAPSPVDRRYPWLKWLGPFLALVFVLPGLHLGGMRTPPPFSHWVSAVTATRIPLVYQFGYLALGLISLAANFFSTTDPQSQKKFRVIFWGTFVGLTPAFIEASLRAFGLFDAPAWVSGLVLAQAFLFPLSLAYAVVKHRVLDLPVLLKRSARYLLVQRGFAALLSLASIALTVAFAFWFSPYLRLAVEPAQPAGIALGAVFGTCLLWSGSQVHKRVNGKIDRAFFRNSYDTRLILEELAGHTRTVRDRAEMALLLEKELKQALHPEFLVVYLLGKNHTLTALAGAPPPELQTLPADLPVLVSLVQRGAPLETSDTESQLPPLKLGCLVPILGRESQLLGVVALGPLLSDEPYSSEDQRLLGLVASHAGAALDNIRLAEEIAERLDSERRVAREMEIAKEVQRRLLPQNPPAFRTLECGARCIQARAVGGDYYDFIEAGPQRTVLMLADVSGKGVHAALLVANLQAHLRSQIAGAPTDLAGALQQVNRILWRSTAVEHYATLFAGVYDDGTRELEYVNCGHLAPVWLQPGGAIARLEPTAPVIGVFEQWDACPARIHLSPGDLLAIFSDGVTEAAGDGDDEFGEDRFIEHLRASQGLPALEIVARVLDCVQQFSGDTQSDDLTLLVSKSIA